MSNNTRHTPGPWRLSLETTRGEFGTNKVIRDSRNTYIAEVRSAGFNDARLIAAAPELLSTLQVLLENTLEDCSNPTRHLLEVIEDARSVIAKATED